MNKRSNFEHFLQQLISLIWWKNLKVYPITIHQFVVTRIWQHKNRFFHTGIFLVTVHWIINVKSNPRFLSCQRSGKKCKIYCKIRLNGEKLFLRFSQMSYHHSVNILKPALQLFSKQKDPGFKWFGFYRSS